MKGPDVAFTFANINNRSALIRDQVFFDLASISAGEISEDPMEAIKHSAMLHQYAEQLDAHKPTGNVSMEDLCAPIPHPRNSYAIGLNYQLHIEEAASKTPDVPMVFTKFPSCISAPTSDVIMRSDECDYEGELVIVIGKGGKDIPKDNAWSHVLGFCVGQDFSDRGVQYKDQPAQFNLGKSFDTFGPIGPYLVSIDSFTDPGDLSITTTVNGEVRQQERTSNMIFDVPTLVSYISAITTLTTGDIIFSGTPEGVGFRNGYFLLDGDVVETTIEEIGTITNACVRGSDFA
jgi:2-keto-4-pentenoate hydratase/2-oxohepta-3-ene-1,7-dioic acid hydratase in catechol pathway